jgi:hypothetical protein
MIPRKEAVGQTPSTSLLPGPDPTHHWLADRLDPREGPRQAYDKRAARPDSQPEYAAVAASTGAMLNAQCLGCVDRR